MKTEIRYVLQTATDHPNSKWKDDVVSADYDEVVNAWEGTTEWFKGDDRIKIQFVKRTIQTTDETINLNEC